MDEAGLSSLGGVALVIEPGDIHIFQYRVTIDEGPNACTLTLINHATITADIGGSTFTGESEEVIVLECNPGIDIEKSTNGEDADTPTGPTVPVGGAVTWDYVITNIGDVDLENVVVGDDKIGAIPGCTPPSPFVVDASFTCQATGVAIEGQYANTATVTANSVVSVTDIVSDDDPSHYIGMLPAIAVTKTVEPSEFKGTGGVATFAVEVENTGPVTLSLTSLNDDVFGDITTTSNVSSTTCVLPQELDPTEVYSCSFQAFVEGDEATPHINTVTGDGVDGGGNEVDDDDDATVTFDELPEIETTKTPDPSEIDGTGGVVTFTVSVQNTGPVTVLLTSLNDDRFGNLTSTDNISSTTCVLPQVLDLTEVYTCSFQAFVEGDEATPHTNTVTAQGFDKDLNPATDPDDATVTFDQLPEIRVVKVADPVDVLGTSGVVTFTVAVRNVGPVTVTLNSLNDDVFGDITTTGNISSTTCVLPEELDLTEVYTCSFQAYVEGTPDTPHVNTVTGSAVDKDGNEVNDEDDATVNFGEVFPVQVPEIEVTKTADPTEIEGSGGVVTFTVAVQNIGPVTVLLTSLIDDPFGDLTTTTAISSTTCVLPQELDLTEVYTCSFQAFVTGNDTTPHIDTVTGTGVDGNGTEVDDNDDATVIFDLLPAIAVTKTADPPNLEVFGDVVTFTVVVHNVGPVSVTVTSLNDDHFGDLTTTTAISSTTCVLPQELDPNESYTCSFQAFVEGTSTTPHVNEVTGNAFDKDGNPATDPGDATVTFPAPTGLDQGEQPNPRRFLFVPWTPDE
jgi:hypothetical protein